MFVKYALPVFVSCCLVTGSKLNETSVGVDNHELKIESGAVIGKSDADILEMYVKKHKVSPWKLSLTESTGNAASPYNTASLHDIVDFWNPYTVARFWNRDGSGTLNISGNCEEHITDYIHGVSNGEKWALKMLDASGKYTWGLLSGNTFWLGASDQCRELQKEFTKRGNDEKVYHRKDIPPFPVSVNTVFLVLQVLQAELRGTYNLTLGLCLPSSCNAKDVERLLYFVQDQIGDNLPRNFTIQAVRNLTEGYSFWDDPLFYILLVVFFVVTVLIILGTLYDIALRYQVLCKEGKIENTDNIMTEMKMFNSNRYVRDEITIAKLWSVKEHNASLDVFNSNTVPKPLSEALLSFSLLLNLSKVFSLDVGGDTLPPIHGLRFLSMLWIILVHTCLIMNVISDDTTFKSSAENDFLYQTLSNSTYSVDTFFFISGCLVSFLYFRTMMKKNMKKMRITKGFCGQILQFLGMMSYRYFRLTPPYLLVIGVIQVSKAWYNDHRMLDFFMIDYRNCGKYWWRNALYINTYFDMDERCLVWSWYLANDTQFYTVGIIILIIGASFLPVAAFITIAFLIVSWIITAIITFNVGHVPSIQDPFAHYDSLYDKPWSRIGPYLIGMITGWYLYKIDGKMQINKTLASIFWAISFTVMVSIVYGLYGNTFGSTLSVMYTTLSHSGWAIAIAWILMACVTGYGGIVNDILSWKYLYPFSRLTYCAYLVHPVIMHFMILRGESSLHLTHGLMAILFLGFTVASYVISLFISLFFEAPIVSLLRIVHPIRPWKNAK